ncbi:MAG TPA: hypothetical protein VFA04_26175 [Bryobacteraceae bacterium]|nr:hypothetical protein [Bryobacteraceae bacterium]
MFRFFSRLAAAGLLVCLVAPGGFAQQKRADPRNSYERIIAVVPLIGSGSSEDPKRPMFVPLSSERSGPGDRSGIIAFKQLASDDGNFALVELVAADRSAFSPILESSDPRVKAFPKWAFSRKDIEAAVQQFRKNFTADQLDVVVR